MSCESGAASRKSGGKSASSCSSTSRTSSGASVKRRSFIGKEVASVTIVVRRRATSPATSVSRPRTSSFLALKLSSSVGKGSTRAVASSTASTTPRESVSALSKRRLSPGTTAACIETRPRSFKERSTYFTCSRSTSRKSFRSPFRCVRAASTGSSKTSIEQTFPWSTSAGCPIKVWPRREISMSSGNSPKVQSVTPSARSFATDSSACATDWKASCARPPSSARNCARLRPISSVRPCSSTTRKFMMRCGGNCSTLKSDAVQGTDSVSRMSSAKTVRNPRSVRCPSPQRA